MNRLKYFFAIIGLLVISNLMNLIPVAHPLEYILLGIAKSFGFYIAFNYRMKNAGIKNYVKITSFIAFILSVLVPPLIWFFIIGGFIYKTSEQSENNSLEIDKNTNPTKAKEFLLLALSLLVIAFLGLSYLFGIYKLITDKEYNSKQLIIGIVIPPYPVYVGVSEMFEEEKIRPPKQKKDSELDSFDKWIKNKIN